MTQMTWEKLLCKDRPRQSTISGDHRAEFERDYDRTIFSTPVKRLQDKAQVFPLEPHDAVRTRLTHSLEVSSVARGLGIAVSKWLKDKSHISKCDDMDRGIEAICATCGLIHDLGNPPFGHSGEDAIRYWFKERFKEESFDDDMSMNQQYMSDFTKFEGNAQSLRLVTKLQILADYKGLNLTYGTLSASCKYTAASDQIDKNNHALSKPGYFASETGIIQEIRDQTGTGNARNPLTFLIEAADDAVYSVADIEDAVKKNIVRWSEIEKSLDKNNPHVDQALKTMKRILKADRSEIPNNLPDDIYASAFRTASIGVVSKSVIKEFQKRYDEIMNGNYNGELVNDCEASELVNTLKTIGQDKVYCTPSNLKLELMGRKVICDLMDLFWEGAKELAITGNPKTTKFPGKAGALLSSNYRQVFQHIVGNTILPDQYHRLQLVTDYISGMTDTFAKRLHSEINNG